MIFGRLFNKTYMNVTRKVFTIPVKTKKFSTANLPEVIPQTTKVNIETVKNNSNGGFMSRLYSFLVGCGIGFGTSFYFIEEELRNSNASISITLDNFDNRIKDLEGKK